MSRDADMPKIRTIDKDIRIEINMNLLSIIEVLPFDCHLIIVFTAISKSKFRCN